MHHAERTAQVRQTIHATFHRLGADPRMVPGETILIREGLYCGRRFHCGGFSAVWFIEENQIKFFGPDGGLLHSQAPASVDLDHKRVA